MKWNLIWYVTISVISLSFLIYRGLLNMLYWEQWNFRNKTSRFFSWMGRIAQSVCRLATGWTVRGSNPGGGGEIFCTCPDRPWGPSSLLYKGYRVFPGGKEQPGREADLTPSSSAIGHERIELCLFSPYEPYGLYRGSVPVQGWPFSLHSNTGKRCTLGQLLLVIFLCEQNYMWGSFTCSILLHVYQANEVYFFNTALYRVIQNDCRGFNNLSYTIHLR